MTAMGRTVRTATVLALVVLGGAKTATGEVALERRVREIVDRHARSLVHTGDGRATCNQAPGGIVGVYIDGKEFYYPYGRIDDRHTKPTKETIFGLGSITKTFTVSILGQRPELFDRSVTAGPLPPGYQLQPAEAPVTFEQLATFTGGMSDQYPPGCDSRCSQDQFVAFINLQEPPDGVLPAPNVYSDVSVGFLGQILMFQDGFSAFHHEEANAWFTEHLFSHLGMEHTSHPPRTDPQHPLSMAFRYSSDDGYEQTDYADWVPWGTAGRMFSTAEDMVHFIMANVGLDTIDGKQVPAKVREGIREALRPRTAMGSQSFDRQGFAWVVQPEALPVESRIIGKAGGLEGVSAFVAVNPDLRYGVITLLNMQGVYDVQERTLAIAAELSDLLTDP